MSILFCFSTIVNFSSPCPPAPPPCRQAWLDARITTQAQNLQDLKRKSEQQLVELQSKLHEPQRLVEEAEEAIKEKLRPLLQQAEVSPRSSVGVQVLYVGAVGRSQYQHFRWTDRQ